MKHKKLLVIALGFLAVFVIAGIGFKLSDSRSNTVPITENNKVSNQVTATPNTDIVKKVEKSNNDPNTIIYGVRSEEAMPSEGMVEEINKTLKKKGYDFKVTFQMVDDSITTVKQMQEQYPDVDIVQTAGASDSNNRGYDWIREGYFMKLDEYLKGEGKKLYNYYHKTQWKQVTVKKSIYTVPSTTLGVSGAMFYFNPKYVTPKDVTSFDGTLEGLESILKKAHGEKLESAIVNCAMGGIGAGDITDGLSDLGVKYSEQEKKIPLWFKAKSVYSMYCTLNHYFKEKYISDVNSLQATEDAGKLYDIINRGEYVVCIGSYDMLQNEEIDLADCISYQSDYYFTSRPSDSIGVAKQSTHKEKALTFLQVMNTDKDIANLMLYGVEGKAYIMKDGVVAEKNGDDSLVETAWGRFLEFGNYEVASSLEIEGIKNRKKYMNQMIDKYGKISYFMGFNADVKDYENVIKKLNSTMHEYLDIWKSSDFDKEYKEIIKKLDTKEFNQYESEMNRQLQSWQAESKEAMDE